MEVSGGLSSGIMFALAAGLWLVYLVPSWLKRREYLATEKNAVRLQQTLRVLAESAEVPVEIHAETSARSVASLQRSLRQQQELAAAVAKARDAAEARTATRRVVEAQPALAAVVSSVSVASRRLRRTRAVTGVVFLASIAVVLVQLAVLAIAGLGAVAPAVLAFGAVGTITSLAMLSRLAKVSRARAAALVAPAQQRPTARTPKRQASGAQPVEVRAQQAEAPRAATPWTPVAVPKPLYLSRPAAQPVTVVAAEVAAELREAAAASDFALRAIQQAKAARDGQQARAAIDAEEERQAAQAREQAIARRAAEQAAQPARTTPIARPSRFAAMGIVDESSIAAPDIDAVLRRRRTAS